MSIPRLGPATLDRLAAGVARPAYDRAAQRVGIVHLGIGAFHRAHQAVHTEAALAGGDRDWTIAGVSLRSGGVRDALSPQDGLYTVTERGPGPARMAVIGSVRGVVVAPEEPAAVAALLATPSVHVVTLTVTEKGYRPPDGDDRSTIYHHLAAGLALRRARGLPGVTLVSCDNLSDNGGVLARGLGGWLDRTDPSLRRWFEAECACPATMVDRIVPAVAPTDLDQVAAAIGVRDEGAVITEPYHQWIIADRFAGPRPRWELGGARFVADVAPFEAAKLRMLNGAHSALAYLGLLAGHAHVHQAIADPSIAATVGRLIRDEAARTLAPPPGQDLAAYADALIARFRNPALPHRLIQIAADGSQKIPQRWLEPLAINARHGRHSPATLRALAAWLLHVRGTDRPVVDPLAEQLAAAWADGPAGAVTALFGETGPFASPWRPDPSDAAMLRAALHELDGGGVGRPR